MKKRYIDQLANSESTDEEQEEVLRTLIQAHLNAENREKWSAMLQEKSVQPQLPVWRRGWRLYAAAAAIVVLIAGVSFWRWQLSQTPAALAYQFIQEDEPLQLPSGFRGQEGDTRKAAAIQSFNAKDYTGAIRQLKQIESTDSTLQADLFLMGMCYFYSGDYPGAIQFLSQAKSGIRTYRIQTDWFLALAYLRTENDALAKPLLQRLADDPDSGYADRAKLLLKQF